MVAEVTRSWVTCKLDEARGISTKVGVAGVTPISDSATIHREDLFDSLMLYYTDRIRISVVTSATASRVCKFSDTPEHIGSDLATTLTPLEAK